MRVTRSELARLLAGERVEEAIHFAPGLKAALHYTLMVDAGSKGVRVSYCPGEIATFISSAQASVWGEENQVGIYAALDIGTAGLLEVAIEKDFACLDGSDADNHDTFENPLEGKTC